MKLSIKDVYKRQVLDIRFAHDELPPLLNAIEIDNDGAKLVAEVAQQVGDDVVRCIAMNSTDGLVRGAKALDTGDVYKRQFLLRLHGQLWYLL